MFFNKPNYSIPLTILLGFILFDLVVKGVIMIAKIIIDKFKSIDHLEIIPSGAFNVIIGENNIGKTTIFEAIHLWKMCYDQNIKKDKSGFYASARNMKFDDMEFIRVYHDEDIFPVGCNNKDAVCKIVLEIEYESVIYSLGFKIVKVSTINDAYLQVTYVNSEPFKNFANMVSTKPGKNLSSFIVINESRPIPNIIAKEPYMYKDQVRDKIAKGKNNEVLRNQVISNIATIQSHINHVMCEKYVFSETDKDDKTYISLKVNGNDIFSYGSGFLQLTEIFASMEYLESEIYILLIDEPDAHLHLKLQKRLIDEFRQITNSQLFIITHNERFLEQVDESEILFVDNRIKQSGTLSRLPIGSKKVALENLKGCLEQFDKLRYASKIIVVEGQTDIDFFESMRPIYEKLFGETEPANVYLPMVGIDTLNAKLITYSRALKSIIPQTCKWIVIRDTDCVPCNKKQSAGNDDIKSMDTTADVKVLFQEGYGLESTFASDKHKFARLLSAYYEIHTANIKKVEEVISEINTKFNSEVKDITNSIHQELKKHFERQILKRTGRTYKELKYKDVLMQITPNNIQYILTKEIMDKYLISIHKKIKILFPYVKKTELTHNSIFNFYYTWISDKNDIFDCHLAMLKELYLQ